MARDEREQKALDMLNDKSIPTDDIIRYFIAYPLFPLISLSYYLIYILHKNPLFFSLIFG